VICPTGSRVRMIAADDGVPGTTDPVYTLCDGCRRRRAPSTRRTVHRHPALPVRRRRSPPVHSRNHCDRGLTQLGVFDAAGASAANALIDAGHRRVQGDDACQIRVLET
jgi:hypothetical protein